MKHELESYEWGILPIRNYRGCLVSKIGSHTYSMWGKTFKSPKEIDEAIDNAGQSISNSLVVKNDNGNFTAINEDGI